MAFRVLAYLIPSCDGCGLAWSFTDPAYPEGIPPHYAGRAAALADLPARYGWQIQPRRWGRPLMVCRRCAAAGVIPASPGRRWLLAVTGWIRCYVPLGPVLRALPPEPAAHHPESMTALLRADEEDLLAAIDDELFPDS